MSNRHLPWVTVAALFVATCAPGRDRGLGGAEPEEDGGTSSAPSCTVRGAIKCDGGDVLTCDGTAYSIRKACPAPRMCIDAVGCVECRPDATTCVGDSVRQC